ncbi:hypothetical protein Hanom_Chr16g01477291 [Helianthus anomalus]
MLLGYPGCMREGELGSGLPSGKGAANKEGSHFGDQFRWGDTEEGMREKVGSPLFSTNENFSFFLNKKTITLRGECHYQIGVREDFKRGVDVT